MSNKILIITIMLFISCENFITSENEYPPNFFELYMDTTLDDNGYYLVDYPNDESNSYVFVKYRSLPMTRVFWTSTDSFTIYYQGFPFSEPIINNSTYTLEDSTGQQLIYLYQAFIGDTLGITGYVSDNLHDNLKFIVY